VAPGDRLEIQLCGALRVSRGDEVVDLAKTGRQGRLALAYLVLNRDRAVTREELMEHLWVDPDPQRVAASLTQTLSRLRGALGREHLLRLPAGALQVQGDVGVDIDTARAALRAGRDAFGDGAWETVRQSSQQVLAVLAGEVLAGDEAEWLDPVRREVVELCIEALELRGTAALRMGLPADAETAARSAIERAETRESAWALLIEAHAARGDLAAATATFHEFRTRLDDRYGLTPSRRLIDLHSRLVQGDGARTPPRAPPQALPPRLRQASRAAFVGRGDELVLLTDAWSRAQSAGPGLVLVEGTSGIGKTRLAAQLADAVREGGATVLYGRADEDLGAPYQPWIDILDQYVGTAPDHIVERHLQTYGPLLGRLVPALGRDPATRAAPQTTDPEAERYMLFGAVSHLLAEASEDGPLLLVLDDLHWADKPTLLLVRHLVGSGRAMRMLVVGVSWGGFDDPGGILKELAREPGALRMELEGLTPADVNTLFETAAERPLSRAERSFAEELTSETSGNPFFLLQILRHLRETGAIVAGADGWELTQALSAMELPEMVRHVVARRTARLGDEATRLLRIAAVIGREFDVDVLAHVGRRSEEDVLTVLSDAVSARLVAELGGERFTFSHALLNRSLASELLHAQRARLHLRIAEALEDLGGEARLGQLAHHRLAAGVEHERAIAAASEAGRWALARLAPHEAARWFEAALERLTATHPADRAGRCELLILLGDAQRQAGDGAYRGTLLEAAALAGHLEDADRLARAVLANTRGFESASGNVDADRVATLEAAIALLGEGDDGRRARLLAQLQLEQTFVKDLAERRRLSDEAKRLASGHGDPTTLAHVLWARHAVLWTPELLAEHRANAAELEAVAAGLNDPVVSFWAACDVVLTSVWSADLAEIDRGLATMQEIADRVGQPILRWIRHWYGSWRAYLGGDLDEAERLAIEAGQEGTRSEQPDAQAFSMNQLMPVAWDRGRLGETIPLLEQVAAQHSGLPVFRGWLALAYCEQGDLPQASRVLEADAATGFRDIPWDIVWPTTVCLFAEVATRLRARPAAAVLRTMLAPYTSQVVFNAISVHGSVAHFSAGLAATLGDLPAADAEYAAAAEVHQRLGARGMLARTRYDWGQALLAGDDAERAGALLAQATATADELGMQGILQRTPVSFEGMR
jgi:DNA-binding SARP family transcriptional activator